MSNDVHTFDHGGFGSRVRALAGRLSLVRDVVAGYCVMMDEATPMWAKAVLAGGLACFILPSGTRG